MSNNKWKWISPLIIPRAWSSSAGPVRKLEPKFMDFMFRAAMMISLSARAGSVFSGSWHKMYEKKIRKALKKSRKWQLVLSCLSFLSFLFKSNRCKIKGKQSVSVIYEDTRWFIWLPNYFYKTPCFLSEDEMK